jgi:hypothetical protein
MSLNTSVALANSRRLEVSVPAMVAWGIGLVGVLLLVPRLLEFVHITTNFITWPWQFDFSEGINLNATSELAAGHNIYRNSNPGDFISTPYTPVFYFLTAPITWLVGPSLAVGRIISLLATLVIAALLAFAVGKVTSRWAIGILTSAVWLCISPVMIWSPLYTQHLLALAFGFGGLVWVMFHRDAHGISFLVGPLLLGLAFLTKQSVIDVSAAVVIWLFLVNPRRAIRFGLILAGIIVTPFIIDFIFLKGGLWEHAISNQGGLPYSDRRFSRLFARLWNEQWPLFVIAITTSIATVVAAISLWRKQSVPPGDSAVESLHTTLRSTTARLATPYTLATFYFLLACVSVLVRLGRAGVSYNHYIDCLLPACLVFGLGLGWSLRNIRTEVKQTRNFALVGTVLGSVLLLFQVFTFTDPRLWYSGAWPEPAVAAKMQAWSNMVADVDGEVYSEDAYLAISNGKRLPYDDDFMFMQLASLGRWDQSSFVQSLWDRRFSLVILQTGSTRFSPEASQALDASYTLKVEDRLHIYAPNPVPSAPQYRSACTFAAHGDSVNYLGYSLPPNVAAAGISRGQTLHVTLYWQPTAPIEGSYATYVQLLNNKGERVLGQDNPQTAADRPTNKWLPDETILDSAGLALPAGMAPGIYTVIAGMYLHEDGNALNLSPACGENILPPGPLTLGTVEVK